MEDNTAGVAANSKTDAYTVAYNASQIYQAQKAMEKYGSKMSGTNEDERELNKNKYYQMLSRIRELKEKL
jgi:hypothetical protein